MEDNSWTNGCGKRQDLDPIIEEENKSISKDSMSDTSNSASTVKPWDCRWTPSEVYDSTESSSTSTEQGQDYSGKHRHRCSGGDFINPSGNHHDACRSQGCLCQTCLLGYARSIQLQRNVPNICSASSNAALLAPLLQLGESCRSICENYSHDHRHVIQQSQNKSIKEISKNSKNININNSNNAVGNKCNGGSLDRRRRRLRNRSDRDQRARSQSDLLYCDREQQQQLPRSVGLPHYCSLQQFQCHYGSNPHVNYCNNNNTEERLRKLENERAGLHMEISVLSEQVEAQSSKIIELENLLQDKKDTMRQMEEVIQKEVLARSALETQKLELLTTLSEMKLRQASLEHENVALHNASTINNGEKFSRHAGQYCSLPRPPTTTTTTKRAVAFGKVFHHQQMSYVDAQTTVPLAVRGSSARCLSAPVLAEEERIVINEREIPEKVIPPKSLSELSMEEIEEWLGRLGLESYAPELRRWGATGKKLLESTNHQIEKELDIKNTLHRKKMLYAIECERCNGVGFLGSEKMDNGAVLRWLDDIGLPQHKESFHNAKIDGRVLHRLTTDDLMSLGVTALLHAVSLRRGIQILRELNFEFDNLERRSANGDGADGSNVAMWTNHRVMEWLRVVDLAEYAPNMRGSGVHGGLMIHDGRFTSELLATLLSIPPSKTLLRRHLTTHFNQILGREVVQHKRESENTFGFVPLTLTARLKAPKKSQFTLKRKKSKNEIDYANLVCPLESSPPDLEVVEHRRIIGCI
ncbi:liprin-beta-1-like isoform X2 [Aphidius gifuensis]|uniref:liprin-beta-1-like isoform X2 n=1 Tax=Aphidius gifuensis TaxID=684658 RepID=UPI001CDBE305|nr:liprin-beta-1-like isoform X2 [Aphidius gifuensis]